MDLKWWGLKHLEPSYFCELSLLTKFQPPDMPRNGLKAWSWKKGPKKTLKSPMDPLRVKWWGPKHLGPSYFCELSFPTKFQTSKTSPSLKFWWGNCCSCCCSSCCDRGKTKSTPSLRFRLRLEFDNKYELINHIWTVMLFVFRLISEETDK